MRADVSNAQTAQYCHNELGSTLFLARITTGEHVVHYITLLFQKVILLRSQCIDRC